MTGTGHTVPTEVKNFIESLGGPVTSEQIDVYSRYQDVENASYRIRTIVEVWKDQQDQDRKLRSLYAWWLFASLAAQALTINVVFILIGASQLTFEPWTAKTFIMSVFAEVTLMVLLVVKYLFTRPDEGFLKLLSQEKNGHSHGKQS